MKTKLAILVSLGLVAPAFADTHLFECKVKEADQTVTVRFGVTNLADPKKARLENVKGSEEYSPIAVEPKELKSGVLAAMNTLNDQGGDLRVGTTQLTLFGDGDGFTYVWLTLYKNTNYTKGYVRVKGQDARDSWFQNIQCTHRVD